MNRIVVALVLVAVLLPIPAAAQLPEPGDVDLSELKLDREPTVGVAVVVTAVVFNNGTQPMQTSVQFTYGDGSPLMGASGVGDTNGRVVPANSKSFINLTWVPIEERVGDQVVRAVLRSQGDADGGNNEKAITAFVRNPKVNVTVEAPLRLNLSAGSTGFLRYTVRNDGNAPDTFLVEAHGNASWKPRVLGDAALVPPGGERTGEVAYTAPTEGDMNLTLSVSASSSQRANASATAFAPFMQSNLTLAPLRRVVALSGLPTDAQVLPGENVTWMLTLRNLGTADDVVLLNATLDKNATGWRTNVTAPANQTGWTSTPDVNGTLAIALSAGQTRQVRLNVTRLANATQDGANLTVLAVSNDSALLRALQPNGEYQASLDARLVNASPELALLGFRQPGRTYQGDALTLGIEVANLGRLPAPASTVHVEITDGSFVLRQADVPVRALAAGEFVNLTWDTTSNDLQGAYQVAGRLIPAVSGDRSPDNNEATSNVVVRRPDIEVRAPDSVDAVPGARLLLLGASTGISVNNGGASDETIDVRLASDDAPWLNSTWTVDVPAAGTVVLPLDVAVPRYPHLALAKGVVSASIAGRTDYGTNVTITFRIADEQGPDAELLAPNGTTTVGERTEVVVRADDATGVADATLIVATPGGERVLLTLEPNATDRTRYNATYTPPRAGTYLLEVRLGDATAARHATLLANLTWVVKEKPYRGFAPANFKDGGSTNLRLLKLREVDGNSTATVEADAGDGYRALAFPYEVRPNGWSEGPHVLKVRAKSLGGQTWSGQWNVTLDTTAPTLANLSVKTSGGLTTVTVSVEGAQNVTAQFLDAEGGQYDAQLHPAASRTFTGAVRPPNGWTRLVILAHDSAGNAASLEEDSGAKRTPAPLALGLAALALAALATPRRRRGQ